MLKIAEVKLKDKPKKQILYMKYLGYCLITEIPKYLRRQLPTCLLHIKDVIGYHCAKYNIERCLICGKLDDNLVFKFSDIASAK